MQCCKDDPLNPLLVNVQYIFLEILSILTGKVPMDVRLEFNSIRIFPSLTDAPLMPILTPVVPNVFVMVSPAKKPIITSSPGLVETVVATNFLPPVEYVALPAAFPYTVIK